MLVSNIPTGVGTTGVGPASALHSDHLKLDLQCYRWQRDYSALFQSASTSSLSVGGDASGSAYGLRLDSELRLGSSAPCGVFGE
jgi:hypothetical protein